MKYKKFMSGIISIATIAIPAATLVACGNSDNDSKVGFVQLVTDSAPIEDKSFNEQARDAAKEWAKINGKTYGATKSKSHSPANLSIAWQAAIDAGAEMLIVTGFGSKIPYEKFAKSNPNKNFVFIDGHAEGSNIISLDFKIEQAAFLAAIASGIMLNLNSTRFLSNGYKVGGWGGRDVPPIWAFLGGYQQGIAYFNKNIAKDKVNMVEWVNPGSNRKSMISDTWDAGKGKPFADKLLAKNVDLILPVAGIQTNDAISAIKEQKSSALIVGVDTDQTIALGQDGKYAFTSIMKNIKSSTIKALDVLNGKTVADIIKGQRAYWGLEKDFVKLAKGLISKTTKIDAGFSGKIKTGITTSEADRIYKTNAFTGTTLSSVPKSIWEIVSTNPNFKIAAMKAIVNMSSTFSGISSSTFEAFDKVAARSETSSN